MGIILPQEVEIRIATANYKHYEALGYKIPIRENGKIDIGAKIKVHVLDLPRGSHTKVKVQCDSCFSIYEIGYKEYVNNNYHSNRTWCNDCSRRESKPNRAHVHRDKKQWQHKSYAVEQVKNYIEKYGTLEGYSYRNNSGARIAVSLRKYGYDLQEICESLGYDYNKLRNNYYDEGFLDNIENLKNIIIDHIDKYGCFPSQTQFRKTLHVPISVLNKHGGMRKLKKLIIGDTANILEDENGHYNKSHYEYIVAQFLIHNNVTYKREQYPFPKPYKYRSDFTIYDKGKEYHIEVWGCRREYNNTKFSIHYNDKRRIKETLYKEYNINLISIEPEILDVDLYMAQNNLLVLFKPFLNKKLDIINNDCLVNPLKLSDEELLLEVMKYSDDDRILPEISILIENSVSVFNEIKKRYKNYNSFAKAFNKQTHAKKGIWTKEFTFDIMDYMHAKYGYLPTRSELNSDPIIKADENIIGFIDGVKKTHGCITDAYLEYYEKMSYSNKCLSDKDIRYLSNLKNGMYFGKIATVDRKDRATKILNCYLKEVA